MADPLPRIISRPLLFQNGCAIGISNRWHQGQYCTILTEAGLVGCGIYDVKTAAEFGQAVAIARGTPQKPLVNPEDLFEAKIVEATPQAIFDTLADPQELTKLIPRVQRVDVLERHSDRARIVTHMALGGAFGTIRCEGELRWVEGESLSFTVRKPLPLENRWTFTPVAGGTEVAVHMSLDLAPMLGPFAQFVPTVAVNDMLRQDLDSMLQRVAARIASLGLKERAAAA